MSQSPPEPLYRLEPDGYQVIPDDGIIPIRAVFPQCDCDSIQDALARKGVEYIEHNHRRPGSIRASDLDKLVSPSEARRIRYGYDPAKDMVPAEDAARALGFTFLHGGDYVTYKVATGEIVGFAERRGVMVDRSGVHPKISRSGMVWLSKILKVEESYPVDESDWFPGLDALTPMRIASRIQMATPTRAVNTVDPDNPVRVEPDLDCEVGERCLFIGARNRKPKTNPSHHWSPPGPIQVCGFDLYRLLGVKMPGADAVTYREKMIAAYQQVIPGAAKKAEADATSPAA